MSEGKKEGWMEISIRTDGRSTATIEIRWKDDYENKTYGGMIGRIDRRMNMKG